MTAPRRARGVILAGLAVVLVAGLAAASRPATRQEPFVRRPYPEWVDGRWTGRGIAYGMHRDGQRPGGLSPSRAEIAEDLRLIAPDWAAIRVYGALEPTETVLDVAHRSHPGLVVLLGVWIDPETRRDSAGVEQPRPEAVRGNRAQLDAAARLAARYPGVVRAIVVGNETQVAWSAHRSSRERLIAAIREMRARTRVPVTTADDYNFWNKPESEPVARECDFLMVHAHPLWNGQSVESAIPWTEAQLAVIRERHPGVPLVLGETGWATQRTDTGDEAKYMKAESSERMQAAYLDTLEAWLAKRPLPVFVFEAFDENWKGGDRPDEVEKHWGLWRADRSAKPALARPR